MLTQEGLLKLLPYGLVTGLASDSVYAEFEVSVPRDKRQARSDMVPKTIEGKRKIIFTG